MREFNFAYITQSWGGQHNLHLSKFKCSTPHVGVILCQF